MILAASVALLAAPANAQTPEQRELGLQVAHLMFDALALDRLVTKELEGEADKMFADIPSRPEWGRLMVDAMREEVEHDLPAFERLFGDSLAGSLSVDELKAGVALMSEPSMRAALMAYSAGGEPTAKPSREAERLASSRAGRAFLKKLETLDTLMKPLEDEMLAELMPGAFRRFADKVEAGEIARKQGRR